MQARFYAPWYGRFLSPDPARDQHFEETQSWNIYSYVQNNPTMKIDPNGMEDYPIADMPQMRVLTYEQSGIPSAQAQQMVAQDQKVRAVLGGTTTAALVTGGVATSPLGAAIAGAGRSALGWGAALWQGAKELFSRSPASELAQRANIPLQAAEKQITRMNQALEHVGEVKDNLYANAATQLEKNGSASIFNGLDRAKSTLATHIDKIQKSDFKTQIAGTIENVKNQITTLEKFIKDKDLKR